MPGFCVSCGTPLSGTFCNNCGARAVPSSAPAQPTAPLAPPVQTTAPAASPAVVQPAVAVTKRSGLGKVLAIVGGILFLLLVITVGSAVYGMYWVKHKVAAYTSAVTGAPSEPIKVVAKGDSCRLLSTADLQIVLGVAIEKSAEIVEDSAPGCAYYTNPEAFAQLQRMAAEQARRQTEEVNKRPGPKDDNLGALLKDTNKMEGIVKTLGLTQPVKDGRVFSFTVQRDFGQDSWSGMRLTESAVPGFEEVPGVGDHAMIGAFGHAFYVLKGNAMIHLDTTWVPDARQRGTDLGGRSSGICSRPIEKLGPRYGGEDSLRRYAEMISRRAARRRSTSSAVL